MDIGQQADEVIANDMSCVFCWVIQPTAPQIIPRAFGKPPVLENQPGRKVAMHGNFAKSPKDGDTSLLLPAV